MINLRSIAAAQLNAISKLNCYFGKSEKLAVTNCRPTG